MNEEWWSSLAWILSKNTIILRGEVDSVGDLRKIYSKIDLNEICQVPQEALISDKNCRMRLK